MSLTASDQVDFSDPQAVITLLNKHTRELAFRDRLLAEKNALLASKDSEIAARDEKLTSRDQQIEHLKLLLEKMRRDAYGARSEKLERSVDQLELKLEELESDQGADEVVEQLAATSPSRVNRHASRFPIISGVKSSLTHRPKSVAPTAAASFASSVKMSRSILSASQRRSRSSVMCA